tara:strand:- start:6492 stop:7649 length:1158 start_codon:yes stop_codon:yes gene_type:complete
MTFSHESVELEYYIREGISPVHYDLSDLNKHFQTRASLYRLLGLVPSFLNGKDIIEVGPGSGHNSIYTATLIPRTYDLVEPNPVARNDIAKVFGNLSTKHTYPNIVPQCVEDLKSDKQYDIAICEGWLGGIDDYEKNMLIKLSSFVKSGGLMFITLYSPIGGMATFLRRLLGYRLITKNDPMKKKINILEKAFSSHLNTMSSMSRSHKHWIQDSILNPHIYVGISTPRLFTKILGDKFVIYQSVPRFASDWRWYKSLHGQQRKFNEIFLTEYDKISHCMIDFRMDGVKRSIKKNKQLEKFCFEFAMLAKDYEDLGHEKYMSNVEPLLSKIIRNVESDLTHTAKNALREVSALLKKKVVEVDDVADMSEFPSFFGREQCYLSITRE